MWGFIILFFLPFWQKLVEETGAKAITLNMCQGNLLIEGNQNVFDNVHKMVRNCLQEAGQQAAIRWGENNHWFLFSAHILVARSRHLKAYKFVQQGCFFFHFFLQFDNQLGPNFHRFDILCICWDTPNEKYWSLTITCPAVDFTKLFLTLGLILGLRTS